jgi:hypothetical protein
MPMNRRTVALTFAGLGLLEAGCEKKAAAPPRQMAMSMMMLSSVAGAAAPEHFIAERHKLEVVAPESELQKSWARIVSFCGTLQCEVVSSSITTRTGELEPSGALLLRVAPGDLQRVLDRLQSAGQIATHTTERVDKTTEVIDTEAKIKNLTSFRDNLRGMLGKPSATVKDLVEIQQQLTDTQSQLDSETAQRKILANETEKVAVEISFRVARTSERGGAFSEIRTALRESGSVLADSIATMITVIVAVIPWLILIVPGWWILAKAWRNWRRNRKGTPAPAAVEPLQKA